jgi:hypothetical protein
LTGFTYVNDKLPLPAISRRMTQFLNVTATELLHGFDTEDRDFLARPDTPEGASEYHGNFPH